MNTTISKKIFENSDLGFAILHIPPAEQAELKDYFFEEVNSSFEKLTSLNKNLLIERSLGQIFSESEVDQTVLKNLFEKINPGKDSQVFEHFFHTTSTWVSVSTNITSENNLLLVLTEITAYKLTEVELQRAIDIAEENAANTTAIIEGTTDSVWAFDTNYHILYINKVFQRDFKQAFDVLLEKGSDILTSLPEPLRPFWLERYNRVLSNEQFTVVDEVETAIGTIYIQVIFNPIIQNGQVVGGSCFGSNITEKINSEKQLRRLSQAVEQSPASVVMTDLEGRIVYVNGKFTQVTGYTLEEAKGKNPNILKSGELSDETYAKLWNTISSGGEWRGELHNRKKSGELFWESATISPIKNSFGEIINYLAIKEDITERKRWQQELEFSETRLRSNLENTPNVAVQWYDNEGRILYWNSASENLYGWSSKEVMGKTLDQFIYGPEEAEGFLRILKEIEKTGVKYGPYESPIHRRDGSNGWIMCTTFSFPLEAGRVGFVCMDIDITERKLAEEQLLIAKEKAEKYNIINEARLRLIQYSESHSIDEILEEALNVAESITESKIGFFHFVEADQKNLTLQNWSTDTKAHYCKAEGKGLHYPIDRAGVWVDCVKERRPVVHNNYATLDHKRGMPEGHAYLERELVIPIMYDETVKAIFGIGNKETDYNESDIENASLIGYLAWEIVEKKRIYNDLQAAKEKAEQSEKKLLEAQEIAKMGSWELDIRTGIFTFTDSFYRMFHTTAEAVGGYQMRIEEYAKNFVHPDDMNLVAEENNKAIAAPNPNFSRYLEHRILYADGGIGYISVRFFVVKDEYGNTIKTYGVNQDITEKKLAEEELLKAKLKAEESDRLKSAFLANMSHEIRTPMNGILGFLELLQNPHLSDESRGDFISLVNKSGKRLLDTINDIIEISKIESGQLPINFTEINIHDLISYQYKFFKREAENKGLSFSVNDFVTARCSTVITDRHKLDGILTNLIKNAIKFTTSGGIELTAKIEEGRLIFIVKDTGIGISAERINIIFERFVQADFLAYNRPYEGSGLGLPIVKAYLDMLKGEIWVESTPGVGSTFGFSLPVEIPEQVEASESKPTPTAIKKFSDLTILVAEDDDISFEYFQLIFQKFGGRLIRAMNGMEVMTLLDTNSIDIIFMDIKMPLVNGIDATKRIRETGNNVYIIALTAFALPGDREWALKAGCNDYLSKPVSISNFIEALDKYTIFKTKQN